MRVRPFYCKIPVHYLECSDSIEEWTESMDEEKQRERRERNERERELLRRIAKHDRDASPCLEELLKTYRLPILSMFSRARTSPSDADALLNGVLMKVWEKAKTFRDEAMVSTWIFKIAKNHFIDTQRSEKRHWLGHSSDDDLESQAADDPPPEESIDAANLNECLQQQLDLFSRDHPQRAEVLRMQANEQGTVADIAFFLSRSEHATRQYLYASRKKLDLYIARCAKYKG